MLLPQLQDVTSTSSSWWLRGFLLELLGDEAFRRRGELEPQAIALLVNAHARLQMSNPLLFELFLHQTCLRFLEWTSIPCSFETLCLVISEGSRLVFTLRLSRTWFSKIQGLFLHKIFRAGFVLTIFNLFVSSRVLSPNHEKVMKHYLQLGSFMETTINHKLSTSPLLMVTYGDRPHHWISVVKRCLDSPSAAASRERSETMFVLMHQSCLVRS